MVPGGALDGYVADFTFFPNHDSNAAFLEVLNFAEGCEPGNGLCENLARYSLVSLERRKEYINSLKGGEDPPAVPPTDGDATTIDAMIINGDAATELEETAEQAMIEEEERGREEASGNKGDGVDGDTPANQQNRHGRRCTRTLD